MNPLDQAMEMQQAAARIGFDWRETAELWAKLSEEVSELQSALAEGPERVKDELGDILFMVVNIARHLGVSPAEALSGANRKFERRFAYILRHQAALPALDHPGRLDAMERLWQEAKRLENAAGV